MIFSQKKKATELVQRAFLRTMFRMNDHKIVDSVVSILNIWKEIASMQTLKHGTPRNPISWRLHWYLHLFLQSLCKMCITCTFQMPLVPYHISEFEPSSMNFSPKHVIFPNAPRTTPYFGVQSLINEFQSQTCNSIIYILTDKRNVTSKREVPRDVRNSKVRRQDKFNGDWLLPIKQRITWSLFENDTTWRFWKGN